MRFPWQKKPEARQSQTDAIVTALLGVAAGGVTGRPDGTAALETAAGLYARSFWAAEVSGGPDMLAQALPPETLGAMARSLIRTGDSLHLLDVDPAGAVKLSPASAWEIRGSYRPEQWVYRATLSSPSGETTTVRAADSVVHLRYGYDPRRPWRGLGPLQWAAATGAIAGNTELRLGEEAGASVGAFLPVPRGPTDPDDDTDHLAGMRADIEAAKGKGMLVETTSAGWTEGQGAAPMFDWKQQRFGANPPASVVTLRSEVAQAVLAACGVPSGLIVNSGNSAARESWRQFLFGSVGPLARIMEAELSAKLGVPISLRFDELRASDLAGRARAFQSLVGGGMEVDKAARLASLLMENDE